MTVQQPDGAVRPEFGGASGEVAAPALPRLAFVLTGIAQLCFLLVLVLAASAVASWGFTWITAAANAWLGYVAALAWTSLVLAGWELAAVLGKWLLVGRLRPRRIRLWSLAHLRFWAASLLVRSAPAARLIGSPWQRWHLTATGARIGAGSVLLCATPAAPDLLKLGPNCLVGERTLLSGQRPAPGELILDRIQLGADATVGDDCVLEPGCVIGDQARLAPTTSLQPGQSVPPGQTWHGSPGRPTDAELPPLPRLITAPRAGRRLRLFGYALAELIAWILGLSLVATAIAWLSGYLLTDLIPAAADGSALGLPIALGWAAALSGALILISLIVAVALSALPRIGAGLVEDSRVFPLHSGRWAAVRLFSAVANQSWLNGLSSGSVLATRQLRFLGWQLRRRPDSFEAFGEGIGQASPTAVTWGAGSVAGERLWIANVECSTDAFRVHPARIGADCAIGDEVRWPSAARVGDGCEVAPRTALPLAGPLRIWTSLAGSPAIESERAPSEQADWSRSLPELYRQLADRARADLATIGVQLLVSWLWLIIALVVLQGLVWTPLPGWLVSFIAVVAVAVIRWTCWLSAEAIARTVTPPRPVAFALRDHRFSRHRRVRRLGLEPPSLLAGTALRPLWWRLRGAQVGRCVFDDGARLSEPSLVRIGDQVSLGHGSVLQGHQTKDAAYSLAEIELGDRVVLGNASLLLGGTRLGTASQVAADAVLFGVDGPAHSRWTGNPAVATAADFPMTARPEAIHQSEVVEGPEPSDPPVPTDQPKPERPEPSDPPVPTDQPDPVASTGRRPAVQRQLDPIPQPTPSRPRASRKRSIEPTPAAATTADERRLGGAPLSPGTPFTVLGTTFPAVRVEIAQPTATLAVLDLSGTPLRELHLPQTLAGFGIPEECLEDDLSLRDSPISSTAEIRSLLARVLLRQLLSQAHPEHQPQEWGFIRTSGGGLRPFWPTAEEWVSLGRSDAVVVAVAASAPIGVAVVPHTSELDQDETHWLSPDEAEWLDKSSPGERPSSLARMAALKTAALKAVSEFGGALANELDTVRDPAGVCWRQTDGTERSLTGTAWSIQAGGVQHWIAVVGPVSSALGEDEAQGVDHDGGL
jgi:non-ribosomal peptide synthetase-like protein